MCHQYPSQWYVTLPVCFQIWGHLSTGFDGNPPKSGKHYLKAAGLKFLEGDSKCLQTLTVCVWGACVKSGNAALSLKLSPPLKKKGIPVCWTLVNVHFCDKCLMHLELNGLWDVWNSVLLIRNQLPLTEESLISISFGCWACICLVVNFSHTAKGRCEVYIFILSLCTSWKLKR